MARAGRKRKPIISREPNGRPQRPTMQQLNAMQVSREDAEKVVALAQPHRGGDKDQLRGTALGRFLLQHVSDPDRRRDFYRGVEEFGNLIRRWQNAWGVPPHAKVPSDDIKGGGTGEGASWASLAAMWERICKVDNRLIGSGQARMPRLIRRLVLEDREVQAEPEHLIVALWLVSVEMGTTSPKSHPFH
jgi:hypothetical protein